jgi:hypothetical protein
MDLQFTIGVYKEHLITIPQYTKGMDQLWTWRQKAEHMLETEQLDAIELERELERIQQWAIDCD